MGRCQRTKPCTWILDTPTLSTLCYEPVYVRACSSSAALPADDYTLMYAHIGRLAILQIPPSSLTIFGRATPGSRRSTARAPTSPLPSASAATARPPLHKSSSRTPRKCTVLQVRANLFIANPFRTQRHSTQSWPIQRAPRSGLDYGPGRPQPPRGEHVLLFGAFMILRTAVGLHTYGICCSACLSRTWGCPPPSWHSLPVPVPVR